jgi:hypothetical protein
MDEEIKKKINEIETKYKENKDIKFLLLQLANLEIKLIGADVMAMAIDIAVRRDILDSRSLISDARLSYGTPWEYEFADKKLLLGYKGGIDEVVEALSKKDI